MKILVDENVTHLAAGLRAAGFDIVTVEELQKSGYSMRTDYSLLKYVEAHDMGIISNDREVIDACMENNILCVGVLGLRQSAEVDWVATRLRELFEDKDSKPVCTRCGRQSWYTNMLPFSCRYGYCKEKKIERENQKV